MGKGLRKEDFIAVNEKIHRLAGRAEVDKEEHTWDVCSVYDLRNGLITPRYEFVVEHLSKWRGYDPLLDTPDLFLRFAKLYDQGLSVESILGWVHEYGCLGLGPAWTTDTSFGPWPLDGLKGPLESPARYQVLSVLLDDKSYVLDDSDPIDGFWDEAIIAAAVLKMYEAVLGREKEEAEKLVVFEFPFMELMRGFNREWWEPIAHRYFGEDLAEELRSAVLGGVREANDFATQHQEATTNFITHFAGRLGQDPLKLALSLCVQVVEHRVRALCYPRIALAAPEGEFSFNNLQYGWAYRNLLGAMYLQMHWLMTSSEDVVRCEHCGRMISLARVPVPGARKPPRHKRFCNEYCRYNHYYQTKKKPAREGKVSS